MSRNSEKRRKRSGSRSARGIAQTCSRTAWRQFVQPYVPSGGGAGFTIGETEGILFALAIAVEQRDRTTAGHCERLALMSVAMGLAMGLGRASLRALYRGGYLHDVGKVGIPDSILFKQGKLSSKEWITMRSHATRGEEICRHMKSLRMVLPIIRHHHERWDGSGYPDGLRGDQIPLLARIVQIVDIYDALTNARPYKRAYSPTQALGMIQEETDRGWRDPQIVKVFFAIHGSVLSRIATQRAIQAPNDECDSMRESLSNLQRHLAAANRQLLEPAPVDRKTHP